MNENVPKLALASILSEDENGMMRSIDVRSPIESNAFQSNEFQPEHFNTNSVKQNPSHKNLTQANYHQSDFQQLPPLETSTIFSPNPSQSTFQGESSALQFLSDHEFDVGITELDRDRSSPPLELKSVDSVESNVGRNNNHKVNDIIKNKSPEKNIVKPGNKYSKYYSLMKEKKEKTEKIQERAKLPFKNHVGSSKNYQNYSQSVGTNSFGFPIPKNGQNHDFQPQFHGQAQHFGKFEKSHRRSSSEVNPASLNQISSTQAPSNQVSLNQVSTYPTSFLKPLKSNYYKEMASSKFMKQYDQKRLRAKKMSPKAADTKDTRYKDAMKEKAGGDNLLGSGRGKEIDVLETEFELENKNFGRDSLEMNRSGFFEAELEESLKSPSRGATEMRNLDESLFFEDERLRE